MKKLTTIVVIAALALLVVAVAGCSGGASSTTPAASTPPASTTSGSSGSAPAGAGTPVTIASFAFSPANVTIKVGGSVTWTNNDSVAHTVTGADFDSGPVQPGSTFSHTFPTAGSFTYHCTIHPSMTPAKVTVQ